MSATDFITTSTQRQDAERQLVQTEQTNAVNTGLVGSADKSGSALKDAPYTIGRKGKGAGSAIAAVARAKAKGTTGTSQSESNTEHADLTEAQSSRHLSDALKGGAMAVAGSAVSKTLDDTELEGADDLFYKGKGILRVARAVKRRMAGPSAIDATQKENSLGKLSEKGYRSKAVQTTPAEAQRQAQTAMYMRQNIAAQAAASGGGAATSGATAGAGGAAAAGGAGAGSTVLTVVAIIVAIVVIISLVGSLVFSALLSGGGAEADKDTGSLDGVAAEIALALKGYGFTDEATAAVLGNMQQESGLNPALDGGDGYGTASLGLLQYSGSERIAFQQWCASNGKVWSSATAQMEWTFSEEAGTSSYAASWGTNLAGSYYRLEGGYESRFGTDYYKQASAFKTADDLDLATYSWMACYEKPGSKVSYGDDVSRLNKRLEYARDFLSKLQNGGSFAGGADYASAEPWQKAIVNAANSTPSPGAGLCAMWVTQVYEKAGLGRHGGNGNSMLAGYQTSTDFANIKVGQIISAQYGTDTAAGNAYGHVGIYIGDGMVMDNIGTIRTIALSEWISQNNRGWVVYGWPW